MGIKYKVPSTKYQEQCTKYEVPSKKYDGNRVEIPAAAGRSVK